MPKHPVLTFRGGVWRGAWRACAVALTLSWSHFGAPVFAQPAGGPFTLPIDDKAKADRGVALDCLKNPATFAASKDKFDNYFQNSFLPSMTRTDVEGLGAMAKSREDLIKRWLPGATNQPAQAELTKFAFQAMGKVVGAQNPPAHPAVQYNAILVIGQLDQKYTDGRVPPEPYAPATKPLTGVVDSATTGNRFPPAVILGAVIGLERHAQYRQTLPPESVAAMSAALVKLVSHDQPIQEMDRDSYSWLRLRAATVLAKLGSVGEKNAIHDAIVKLAGSGKNIDDRCAAAGLLEKLEYKDVKLDDAGTAEPLFALARDLAAAQDQKAREFQDLHVSGGGAPRSFGPETGFGGSSAPIETFPRRQALSRMMELRNGLTKVKPALSEETQKKFDAVLAALKPAINALSEKGTVELTMAEELRKMADAINAAIPDPKKAATDKNADDKSF